MVEGLSLAQSLIDNYIEFERPHVYIKVDGITLVFDDLATLLEKDAKSYPRWLEFIKEADDLRKRSGCSSPLSLLHALGFFVFEDPLAKKLGIESEEELFEEQNTLLVTFDRILEDEELRRGLMSSAQFLLPDQSGSVGYLDHNVVANFIKFSGINSGVLLDLGCGVGYNTIGWEDLIPLSVIGIDRQYHDQWYGEFWKLLLPRTSFIRADFMAGLPFADDSVSAIVMESVVHNVTAEGLAKALNEINRVLKPNEGLFIVGPQYGGELINDWRVFKKEGNFSTKDYKLTEQGNNPT